VLLPKDEIRRRLTGEFAGDVSDASGTLLLNVVKRKWSKKLLEKLELSEDLLPPVFESEEVTGMLTAEAAEALGLSTACKVVAGAGDCAAGAIGNGVIAPGVLSTSIGTSGVMFVHCDQPEYDSAGRLHTFCHAVHGKWHMMGVNLSSGGSLQWWVTQILRGLMPGEGDPSPAQCASESDLFTKATEEAKVQGVGAGGLLFLPYLSGERTPHADPRARGCFLGLNSTHERGHLTRAVMEGVVFALRDSLEIIRALDVPVKQIRASGGGSRNPLWRQMQADIFGQKVVTLESEQGPAFGVALLAMVGDGAYRDITEACVKTIKVASETPPAKSAVKQYEKLYQIYHRQYARLKETFAELSSLT
jgi:xylulokinase